MGNRQKLEKFIYDVGIEGFLRLHSNWGEKSRFLKMLNFDQNRISAARSNLKIITPKPLIVSGRANIRWKDKKVVYNSFI
jgi:hypothetical protein